jgi:hypothetical protein
MLPHDRNSTKAARTLATSEPISHPALASTKPSKTQTTAMTNKPVITMVGHSR